MENKYRPFGRFFCCILTSVFLLGVTAPVRAARTTRVNDADPELRCNGVAESASELQVPTGRPIAPTAQHFVYDGANAYATGSGVANQ